MVLAAIFWLWHRSEGTLSIHSITTQRREAFYWATVFATFALGTALGDFTATSLNFGYLGSGILFGVLSCPCPGLVAVRPQRDRRLLVRLRRHPPPRAPPSPTTSASPGASAGSTLGTARPRWLQP